MFYINLRNVHIVDVNNEEQRKEIFGKFQNVVVAKNVIDQMDRDDNKSESTKKNKRQE